MTVAQIVREAVVSTARTRNAAATTAAILCAARERFKSEGYDEVGIRDIARDVGCDPALISRYFGSKEELFRQVLAACGDGAECMMEVPREQFGAYYARQLVYEDDVCEGMEIVLIMLRAIGSAKAAEIVRRATVDDFLRPFAAWLGGDLAHTRAFLASSMVMGFALNRSLSGEEGVPAEEREAVCERLAQLLQACVE